jgi:phosphoribosylformylglycinamidine synthase
MAVSVVDEAVRNAVAFGADPDHLALLDNFCWGNPTLPDRLGSLVRTCQGCHDAALAYAAPYISGKDSLYNEFNGTPIPGTLLISAIAIVPDMHHVVTAPLKSPGNRLYLLGETRDELGGSLLHALHDSTQGNAPGLPPDALQHYRRLHAAMRGSLIAACHDLSEGGLAVTLAEMALGGRLGLQADVPSSGLPALTVLFSESNGRLIVEVAPDNIASFETMLADVPLTVIGSVSADPIVRIAVDGKPQIELPVVSLVAAWREQTVEPQARIEPEELA